MFLQANDTAGHIGKHPVTTTQTKLQLDYEPDEKRHFGIVNLIFEMNGKLWILVEVLEARRCTSTQQTPVAERHHPQLGSSPDKNNTKRHGPMCSKKQT